jgi:hypothetical protein
MRDAINEITHFTGDDRDHDDVVDALASAFKQFKGQGAPIQAVAGSQGAHGRSLNSGMGGNPFMDVRAKLAHLGRPKTNRSDPRVSAHPR